MQNRLALVFILITVMLDAIGIGLIAPVMPDLLEHVTNSSLSNAAIWGGVLTTAFAVMQFVCGPTVGNLSDRFGRRPILLISLAFMAGNYLLMALATSVWVLLIGRILSGIASATQSTASAYIADISAPDQRAKNFGYIGAGFGVGFTLGPMIGGMLATIDIRAPFYAAALMASANFILGVLVLPETVTDLIRRPFTWARGNPLASFRSIGQLQGVKRLLIIYLIYSVAFWVYPSVWSYYGKAQFGWDTWMVGISLAFYGFCMIVVQATMIAPATKRFGEHRSALLGMLIDLCTYIFYGFITSSFWAIAITPITVLGGLVMPSLQSIMSQATPDNAQGELQGVLSSLNAVAMILSPLVMTATFSAFTAPDAAIHLPGAPFLLSAVLLVVCVAIHVARPRATAPALPLG
ncbi:tetracycline resistance protein, class C [mine drainage metagenome]|uniref:Tetracycline resistance protein, class C n=1 Tax=mine drainage metagenome TaxID=410659 RepID=A0A1J5Q5E8_9ZZZZ